MLQKEEFLKIGCSMGFMPKTKDFWLFFFLVLFKALRWIRKPLSHGCGFQGHSNSHIEEPIS